MGCYNKKGQLLTLTFFSNGCHQHLWFVVLIKFSFISNNGVLESYSRQIVMMIPWIEKSWCRFISSSSPRNRYTINSLSVIKIFLTLSTYRYHDFTVNASSLSLRRCIYSYKKVSIHTVSIILTSLNNTWIWLFSYVCR